MLKQVCVIPFRRDYLLQFNELEETPLERIESVDMLRVIENGDNVKMIFTSEKLQVADTKQDLAPYSRDDGRCSDAIVLIEKLP